eukprot:5708685-Karenia_brevis.AAC.1
MLPVALRYPGPLHMIDNILKDASGGLDFFDCWDFKSIFCNSCTAHAGEIKWSVVSVIVV